MCLNSQSNAADDSFQPTPFGTKLISVGAIKHISALSYEENLM
jgi:hypothetical protein